MGESVAGLVSFFNPVWFKREVGKEVIQTKTPLSSRIGASRRVELSLIGCVLLAGPTGVSGGLRDVCRCYGGLGREAPLIKATRLQIMECGKVGCTVNWEVMDYFGANGVDLTL